MAAKVIRKYFSTFKAVNANFRQLHTVRHKQTGLSTTVLIGTSCTCVVAWYTWKKLRKNENFLPKVYAARENVEVFIILILL